MDGKEVAQSQTLEEIAQRTALDYAKIKYQSNIVTADARLVELILSALRGERERCALIAEKSAAKGQTIGDTKAIARTIRKES